MIFIIIWFDIASEEIELNANPFNPFFMSAVQYPSKPLQQFPQVPIQSKNSKLEPKKNFDL